MILLTSQFSQSVIADFSITVSGSDINDRFMVTPKVQSNFGACVDVFAPVISSTIILLSGIFEVFPQSQDILGAGTTNPSSTKTDSGTYNAFNKS